MEEEIVFQSAAFYKQLIGAVPEQVVSISVATTKEQPGFPKHRLWVPLPLLLSESQIMDVSSQSMQTDNRSRWRRGSPSSQQRLKKRDDIIKLRLQ